MQVILQAQHQPEVLILQAQILRREAHPVDHVVILIAAQVQRTVQEVAHHIVAEAQAVVLVLRVHLQVEVVVPGVLVAVQVEAEDKTIY